MSKLLSLSVKVRHGERRIYHNDYERYEDRDITAEVEIDGTSNSYIFGKVVPVFTKKDVKIPKHIEDKLVALWYELEKALEQPPEEE